jgi:hypothetical protein
MSKGLVRRSEQYSTDIDHDFANPDTDNLIGAVNSMDPVGYYRASAHDIEPGDPGYLPVTVSTRGRFACRIKFYANAHPDFVVGVLKDLMQSINKHDK